MANPDEKSKASVTRRGLLLKETREGRGLSIETVHEMTKIPLDVLHAIEEGYTVRMVSAYYFKGFIKMYAKFLGLDPSLVLDEPMPVSAEALASSDDAEPVSVATDPEHRKFNEYISRQSKKQMIINLVMTGIIAVILLISFVVWGNSHPKGKGEVKAAPPPKVQAPKVKKESSSKKLLQAQAADRKIVEQTKPKLKPKVEPKVEKKEPPPPPPEVVEQAPVENTQAAVGKKVTLSIKSKAAGWLQVKVDGNLVFQSTLRAGAVESWQADKTIELSGKNINNLEFEVNGKNLGQLGKSDRGARRVLITKDGLTVKN